MCRPSLVPARPSVTPPEPGGGFSPESITLTEGPGDDEWTMLDDLHWVGEFRRKIVHLTVPGPFETDLASVPRALTWLIPRYGKYTKAAVLHDYYCTYFRDEHIELLPTRAQVFDQKTAAKDETETLELKDRSDADEIFRWTMRELGVGPTTRTYMWTAVSFATLTTCLLKGRTTRPVLRWIGRAMLLVAAVAAVVLVVMGAATALLNGDFTWRWVRILLFAFVVWAWIAFSYLAAGYVAQGRWDRGPAYFGAFVLSVIALPLVVPLATILVFLFLVWLTVRDTSVPPPEGEAPRERRAAAVNAS